MTKSSFYHDGYRDAIAMRVPLLPGIPIVDEEYLDGYCNAVELVQQVLYMAGETIEAVADHVANKGETDVN